jgi:prevent-host-death family protein
MPSIRPSSDLRNKYNEISDLCHKYEEPVYITKNGQGDLAVMSIETFERFMGEFDLFKRLLKGEDDIKNGRVKPYREVFEKIEKELLDERSNTNH